MGGGNREKGMRKSTGRKGKIEDQGRGEAKLRKRTGGR